MVTAIFTGQTQAAGARDNAEPPADALVASAEERAKVQEALASVDRGAAPKLAGDEDEQLLRATSGVPGFAGIWLDDSAAGPVTTIAVAGSGAQAARVAADVQSALRRQPATALTLSEGAKALAKDGARVKTVEVSYSFAQLKTWQSAMDALLPAGAVTFTDADERSNTVTVGVNDLDARAAVVRHAEKAGIPRDALKVVEANFGRKTLRDDHRPVTGGQQISYAIPVIGPIGTIFYTGQCTLGVTARLVNTSPQFTGYLTNSHCSTDYAQTDYVYHWQPTIPWGALWNTANRIGYEILDPSLYTGNPYGSEALACPSGYRCRLSDAAFGTFDGDYTSTATGWIARPATTGTINWNGTDKYRITATGTPTGAIRGVGRTSGMSTGTITSSCVRISNIEDMPNIAQNCQYIGTYSSQPGDSGGPVFRLTNSPLTNDVTFVGLNWGGGTVNGQPVGIVSSWPMMQSDFYPYDIRVCVSVYGC
ncbi:hypothetical protein ACQPYA_20330 [Micromonospora sp. CA-263727]|uniref:hypothetical protein n=1 Tax=Micromonospora sp. CA-263727 TaxID=3239967 RepID=UPI003D950267